jgi:enterochelin esterase-like enzyme
MSGEYLRVASERGQVKRLLWSLLTPRARGLIFGLLAAAMTMALGLASGAIHGIYEALAAMGFDPDRAQLIRALLVAMTAAAASSLVNGRMRPAVGIGLLGSAALFGETFVTETQAAWGATGASGAFDPPGWMLTTLTILFSGLVSAWAGAALAREARPAIVEVLVGARALAARGGVADGHVRRVAGVVIVAALFIVTVPVFGDLVNYSPDSRMYRAPVAPQGSINPAATGAASVGPWSSSRPRGSGQLRKESLPAPWAGMRDKTLIIDVYLPPGYYADPNRRYPTLYEVPWPVGVWNSAINTTATLDSLIDEGSIPPIIVVFVDDYGAPYPDTECADSYDGQQWYDRWFADTLIPSVDSNFRTIARPEARGVAGMSQGGYCSATLVLHHPGQLGTAISFSGYFHAGAAGADSARPFGGLKLLIDSDSPDVIIDRLAPDERASLYFVLVARANEALYGRQATGFTALLGSEGCPHLLIDTQQGHGWVEVRQELPAALEAWAQHMVGRGVF